MNKTDAFKLNKTGQDRENIKLMSVHQETKV